MERNKDLALHLKYRPNTFQEVVGNENVIAAIETILARQSGEVRTFMLTGPSGTGKTTIARIIKNYLNCSDRDFYEYNMANTTGIDTIREIASNCQYAPLSGKIRMYLLDEVHKASSGAQNSLLKLLEDTPKHVRFILCTTDPDKVIKTIHTRCSCFTMSSLNSPKLIELLKWVVKSEGTEMPEIILNEIIKYADGSPRQALVLLDQVIDIPDDNQAIEVLKRVSSDTVTIKDICQALLTPPCRWDKLSKMIKALDTSDYEKVRYAVLGYLGATLLNKDDGRIANIIDLFLESWMYSGKGGMIQAFYLATKIGK
jgi:DNA polymerase III gamma/tau subunit